MAVITVNIVLSNLLLLYYLYKQNMAEREWTDAIGNEINPD